jgi:hypothetical protein
MAESLLVISNLFFVVPMVLSVVLHHWTMTAAYFLSMVSSIFHHTCSAWDGACVLSPDLHRKLDFFFAQWLIALSALYLIMFAANYYFLQRWIIIAWAVGIFALEAVTNEAFIGQLIVGGISLSLLLLYWIGYALDKGGFPPYDLQALVMGLLLSGLACVLFATQMTWPGGYIWIHSVWHMLAAIGQAFLLSARPIAAPRNAAVDKRLPLLIRP